MNMLFVILALLLPRFLMGWPHWTQFSHQAITFPIPEPYLYLLHHHPPRGRYYNSAIFICRALIPQQTTQTDATHNDNKLSLCPVCDYFTGLRILPLSLHTMPVQFRLEAGQWPPLQLSLSSAHPVALNSQIRRVILRAAAAGSKERLVIF